MVLVSSDRKRFGVFALYYVPPLTEHWQLLETHPIGSLNAYRYTLLPRGQFKFGAIKSCPTAKKQCEIYAASSSAGGFKPMQPRAP